MELSAGFGSLIVLFSLAILQNTFVPCQKNLGGDFSWVNLSTQKPKLLSDKRLGSLSIGRWPVQETTIYKRSKVINVFHFF